jgi:ABC-type phosphate/phosphonate transport system ATPase subunit
MSEGETMQKWADYLISGVKSATGSNTIQFVEIHSDYGCLVCETTIVPRADVIANIKKGTSYVTVFKTAMGKWRRGEDVRVVTVNGQEYLRTDAKPIASDNFDDVPEL